MIPFLTLLFISGLVIGSFLNVLIWRIPRGLSIIRPRSHCPECQHKLKWAELIPVLSFLLQGGRCRQCQAKISLRYPIIELCTGALFVFVGIWAQAPWELVTGLVLVSLMIPLSLIDWEHKILPNTLTLSGMVLGLLLAIPRETFSLRDAIIGLFVGGGVLVLLSIVSRGGMGLGDAKYLALIGTFVGGLGTLTTLFIGSLLGSVFGIVFLKVSGKDRKTPIPFGPFLTIGGFISFFLAKLLFT